MDTPVKQPEDTKAKQRAAQQKPIPAQYALNEPMQPAEPARVQGYYTEQPRPQQSRYDYQQPQFDPNSMPFEAVFQAAKAPVQPESAYQQTSAETFDIEFTAQRAPEAAPVSATATEFSNEPVQPVPEPELKTAPEQPVKPERDPKAGIPFDPMAFLNDNAVETHKTENAVPAEEPQQTAPEDVAQGVQKTEGRRRSRKSQRQAKAEAYAVNNANAADDAK